mgnify:CR=1 FL=1
MGRSTPENESRPLTAAEEFHRTKEEGMLLAEIKAATGDTEGALRIIENLIEQGRAIQSGNQSGNEGAGHK